MLFLETVFAQINGNRSWQLTELQYLSLTDEMAKGFLSFATTPGYRKQFFELELRLIKEQADLISKNIGNEHFNLIDIYCGDGFKAVELIKEIAAKNKDIKICYCPLNASQYLLDLAVENVKKAEISNVVRYKPFLSAGDGRSLRHISAMLKPGEFKKNVVVILGGVIACFDINEYLFEINRDLHNGDILIIGNGVRIGERLVDIEKYKDKTFHNWFKHVMLAMGFKESDLEFDARFGNSRVEFVYKIGRELNKQIEGKTITFKQGDEFIVAALYKCYVEEFEKFCKMYFKDISIKTDKDNEYALVVCTK